jgi:nicotinamide-nucleotide adenylyltransferase
MKRALYPGRFQPFHKGHLHAVEYILKEFDELIICVMAAQHNFTLENPFTAGERIWMIRSACKKFLDRIIVIPISNIENNSPWLHNLKSFVPPFEVLFSNHPLVKILAEKEGIEVRPIPFLKREEYVGEKIREMMLKKGGWKELLPKDVVEMIEKIKGVERVRRIKEKDVI